MNIKEKFLQIKKNMPLKKTYYFLFLFLIVIPILGILIISLLVLNRQFRIQSIESIKKSEQTIIATLNSEIQNTSMKMASILYANDNEIIEKIGNIIDTDKKYDYYALKELKKFDSVIIEPDKNIYSFYFYSKKGDKLYLKNYIDEKKENITESKWYQDSSKYKNKVIVGTCESGGNSALTYAKGDSNFMLIFVLFPDFKLDRTSKIESAVIYFSSSVANEIKKNNMEYKEGKNINGYISIEDENEDVIFSSNIPQISDTSAYEMIKTPIRVNSNTWYVNSMVKKSDLTRNFWDIALIIICIAAMILFASGYFFVFFIKSIVNPVEEVSMALLQLEEGKTDIHVTAKGQSEVRTMIHRFNSVARRLKALINEYENELRIKKDKNDYIVDLVRGNMTAEQINREFPSFFKEPYAVIGIYIENIKPDINFEIKNMVLDLNTNSIYSVRCATYVENMHSIYVHYRIMEEDYDKKILQMSQEIKNIIKAKYQANIFVGISDKKEGIENFIPTYKKLKKYMDIRYIQEEDCIYFYGKNEDKVEMIIDRSLKYDPLANYVYTADEKNVIEEREKLFFEFAQKDLEDFKKEILSVIIAIGRRFSKDNKNFYDIYTKRYNYKMKMENIKDSRSLRIWTTNYFSVIIKDSQSVLGLSDTDTIKKAKRFILDNYDNIDLCLKDVADYVELNEKYLSNRFTKETGETFSDYLTSVRIQKAKELLKTTTFKVYEISQMVGYKNVEHFNRVFKKQNEITPNKYRKKHQN